MSDYLKEPILTERKDDFDEIRQRIADALKDFEHFNGVDFVDVYADGIQICGKHKQIQGFYYSAMPTIEYDFSNVDEAVNRFVTAWKDVDNPTSIEEYKKFLKDGARWGWD